MAHIHNKAYEVTMELDEYDIKTVYENLEKQRQIEVQIVQEQQQMSAIVGQMLNVALIANTVASMVRISELEEDDYGSKLDIVLMALGMSIICQLLFLWFAMWRFLLIRTKKDENSDNDCCGGKFCQCSDCCSGTKDCLFTICFTLSTVILLLHLIVGLVGTDKAVPINSTGPVSA